ncbi:hypothetical protein [Desulfolithobacter dissulfuricans]|uniref:hypothetical protein n=1 Tax=Desulfolithobacter dissulfuricans TaxID=2795293 RepID=UPI00227785D9|nr:hypothetical protein [Desulfolithobacter dissulfuricans]
MIQLNTQLFKLFNKTLIQKITSIHGKGKALSILAHKLGRAVDFMLKNRQGFDMNRFFAA